MVTKVSIPLWFDYNFYHIVFDVSLFKLSQFHYGSITTIPNPNNKFSALCRSQFHYGSITTEVEGYGLNLYFNESQFHYGSITTRNCNFYINIEGRSQFHYGSITTNQKMYLLELIKKVSIPLWFDYN